MACAEGKFKEQAGEQPCKLCPVGTYKGEAGPTACKCEGDAKCSCSPCFSCPSGSTSEVGSAGLSDCRCEAGRTGPNGGVCTACNPGTYKPDIGPAPCTECLAGRTSPAGSTEPCEAELPAAVVRMVLGLEMSREAFDAVKQLAFRQSLADITGVSLAMVRIADISSVSRRRSMLAESIEIEVEIAVQDSSRASAIASSMTETAINGNLKAAGLPAVKVIEEASVQKQGGPLPSTTPQPEIEQIQGGQSSATEIQSEHTAIYIAVACVAPLFVCGAFAVRYYRRKRVLCNLSVEELRAGQQPLGHSLLSGTGGGQTEQNDWNSMQENLPERIELTSPVLMGDGSEGPEEVTSSHGRASLVRDSDLTDLSHSPDQMKQVAAERIRRLRTTGTLQITAQIGIVERRPIEAGIHSLQMVEVSCSPSFSAGLTQDLSPGIGHLEAGSPAPSPAALTARRFDSNTDYRELLRRQLSLALPPDDDSEDEA